MEEYKYLNGLRVGDKQFLRSFNIAAEYIWGKKEKGRKPDIGILDEYDYIACHPNVDKTDEIEFFLYFPTETFYMTDLICFADIINFDVARMFIGTSHDNKPVVTWKEKVIYQDLIETQHVDTQDLINVGNNFIQEVKTLKNDGGPVDLKGIQEILNCLKLEYGWHWGLRFAEITDFGDKSWFYCYQKGDDTYCEDYKKSVKSGGIIKPFWKYYDSGPIYDIYKHMNVKWYEMGVWQAYLLSKATALLPVVWHGGYGRKTFLFCDEDKAKIPRHSGVDLSKVDNDLSPKVRIEGDEATVSCCFWNDWRGLYRETAKIKLKGTKLEFVGEEIAVLYEYISGIRY